MCSGTGSEFEYELPFWLLSSIFEFTLMGVFMGYEVRKLVYFEVLMEIVDSFFCFVDFFTRVSFILYLHVFSSSFFNLNS